MNDLGQRLDAWITSKPVKSQRRIALSSMFLMAFIIGSVMAYTVSFVGNWIFAGQPPLPWYWAVGFGVAMAAIVVWKERDNAVPDGGFKTRKEDKEESQ